MLHPAALQLLCLKAPAPQFDASKGADGLPQRILVMPWGEHDTAQGKVIVNDTTVRQLAAYNAAQGWDRPALDFEHSSVLGSPTYQGEPVKVAGFGNLQVIAGEGIYLLMSSWTQEGKDYAAGGHYGDLSPVVACNKNNEVVGCHSAALCRHGATPGLLFLSATTTQTKSDMDPKPPQTADELFEALKTALGAAAEATPADLIKALSAKLAAAEAKKEEGDPAAGEEVKQLTATVTTLSGTVTQLAESVKALSVNAEAGERAAILLQAAREGKEVPKTAAEKMPLAELKLLCAELPVTVPLEQRTADVHTLMLTSNSGAEIKDDEISKHTGVSVEDRKKYAA